MHRRAFVVTVAGVLPAGCVGGLGFGTTPTATPGDDGNAQVTAPEGVTVSNITKHTGTEYSLTATLENTSDETVDLTVLVVWVTDDGTVVGQNQDFSVELAPGEQQQWESPPFDPGDNPEPDDYRLEIEQTN